MKRLSTFLKLSLLFVANLALTTAVSAEITQIRSVEGITEYQLDNGLAVLLFPDKSKETITVNITYRVGSKHENYGETGMAHLLEHLAFKGTPKHPNIAKELTDHGAKSNGTTWLERTNYFETFNASEENLNWALGLESDRMVNSFIAQKDLDTEMTVVRNEFEKGENNPNRILRQRVTSAAYSWHNYGNSTIGARSDIENVDIARLQAFYRRYYQPDNATLIVTGKIDIEKTLALIEKHFSPIPKPKRKLPNIYTIDPVQDGEREVIVRRTADTQITISAYHIPQGSHKDFAAIELLGSIIGNGPNSRLHKALVEKGLSNWVSAWPNRQLEPSLLYFDATADLATDIYQTRDTLIKIVEEIKQNPITGTELKRARKKLLQAFEQNLFDTAHFGVSLSNWIAAGDWRLFFLTRDRIENATLADLQRVAETYLKQQNRTVGLFIPTSSPSRATMPESIDIVTMLDGYRGREPISAGESFDPSPTNIMDRMVRQQLGSLNIAAIPKQTRGDSVTLKIKLMMGNEKNLIGKKIIGNKTSLMLTKGIRRLNRKQIQDEFDQLKATGRIEGGANYSTAEYKTTRDNLPKLIRFLYEIYTTPNFPEDEFNQDIKSSIAYTLKNSSEPRELARNAVKRHFNQHPPGHIYYEYSFDEKIAAFRELSRTDLVSHHQNLFSASDAVVSIVGDFDSKETFLTLQETFANWNKASEYLRPIRRFGKIDKEIITIETPDKANAHFSAAINLNINTSSEDYPAAKIVSYMLGGGFISSRLASRIRQKDGLSYGVWAYLDANDFDLESRFIVGAISSPENTESVHKAFTEEMQKAFDYGFEKDELADAKKGFLDRRKVNLSNDSKLNNHLSQALEGGFGFEREQAFIDNVNALTVDDVNRFIRQYLDPDQMTIIKVGDFSKTAAQ